MSSLDFPSASTVADAPLSVTRSRIVRAIIFLATLGALIYGLQPLWPYLVDEHRRIEPWQWAFLWMGDLAALCWFVAFIVSPPSSFFSGLHVCEVSEAPQPGVRTFLLSMAAAIAIDAGHSAFLHHEDVHSFATAQIAPGEVVGVRPIRGADGCRYYVRVRFRDAGNLVREENIRVQEILARQIPAADRRALVAGRVPFPLRVSFDSGWPARCWLTDAGPLDGDRIYVMSYLVLLFQVGGTLFVAAIAHAYRLSGQTTWWESLQRPLPFMITSFAFFFVGIIERSSGNLHQ
jgi:hypothetical protein